MVCPDRAKATSKDPREYICKNLGEALTEANDCPSCTIVRLLLSRSRISRALARSECWSVLRRRILARPTENVCVSIPGGDAIPLQHVVMYLPEVPLSGWAFISVGRRRMSGPIEPTSADFAPISSAASGETYTDRWRVNPPGPPRTNLRWNMHRIYRPEGHVKCKSLWKDIAG